MGIKNLLTFLRPITRNVSIAKFRGCVVAVDAMCWIHRGAIACAYELLMGVKSDKFIRFIMQMIELLLYYQITPVVVFDGDVMPSKASEDRERRERRDNAVKEARKLLQDGKNRDDKEVVSRAVQAVAVTSDMIDRVLQALRLAGIEVLVAPYEADAQLAYLCRVGYVDAVISEDSDLLAYGCPRVIYKMNRYGDGHEIDLTDVLRPRVPTKSLTHISSSPMGLEEQPATNEDESMNDNEAEELTDVAPHQPTVGRKRRLSTTKESEGTELANHFGELREMKQFTRRQFLSMCVLSGSDYTSDVHITGMGIKTSYKLMTRYGSLDEVLRNIQIDPKWKKKLLSSQVSIPSIAPRYVTAELVFESHWVYDPLEKRVKPMSTSFTKDDEEKTSLVKGLRADLMGSPNFSLPDLIGVRLTDPTLVTSIAEGLVNPRTKQQRMNETFSSSEMAAIKHATDKERLLQQVNEMGGEWKDMSGKPTPLDASGRPTLNTQGNCDISAKRDHRSLTSLTSPTSTSADGPSEPPSPFSSPPSTDAVRLPLPSHQPNSLPTHQHHLLLTIPSHHLTTHRSAKARRLGLMSTPAGSLIDPLAPSLPVPLQAAAHHNNVISVGHQPHSMPVQYSTPHQPHSMPMQYSTPHQPHSMPMQYSTPHQPHSMPMQYSTPHQPHSMPVQYSTPHQPQSTDPRHSGCTPYHTAVSEVTPTHAETHQRSISETSSTPVQVERDWGHGGGGRSGNRDSAVGGLVGGGVGGVSGLGGVGGLGGGGNGGVTSPTLSSTARYKGRNVLANASFKRVKNEERQKMINSNKLQGWGSTDHKAIWGEFGVEVKK
eukprot:GHVN01007988.1.p1 GENE.GHVN01007988.1~~GHVN01007988.1.p1  ORF type:complete len:827 (-),score=223.23 GHVN01007988.1:157-2637(-)